MMHVKIFETYFSEDEEDGENEYEYEDTLIKIDDFIVNKLSLEDNCNEFLGSFFYKNEIRFLFGQIDYEAATFIEKIKDIIEYFNKFDIKSYKDARLQGIEIIFYLTPSALNKLQSKIELLVNSEKYNL